jgi:hypothetical protein
VASRNVASAVLGANARQIGRVEQVGDGVALVSGLSGVRLDEKLEFSGGQFGFAQVLERGRIGCVLLDDVDAVAAGDAVHGTGDVVRVPAGHSTAKDPLPQSPYSPLSGRRRQSSTAIWWFSPCRPALLSLTPCSHSAGVKGS